MIDGAAAGFWIQKMAGEAENRVLLAAQYSLFFPEFGKPRHGSFNRHTEMFSESFYVSLGNLDSIVDGTAVRRTFVAVKIASLGIISDGFGHV